MATQQSGLVVRGLVLMGLMLAVMVGVWFVFLRKPHVDTPAYTVLPEMYVPLVAVPTAGFPSAIAWGPLHQLPETLPSAPGWETRYNAVRALAHRGSKQLPLDVVAEMLDEERQLRNFTLPDKRAPNPSEARQVVLNGLKATAEWHKHEDAVAAVGKDNPQLQKVYAAIEKLTQSDNLVIRKEATTTLATLGRK
jgi:hypothetical protein